MKKSLLGKFIRIDKEFPDTYFVFGSYHDEYDIPKRNRLAGIRSDRLLSRDLFVGLPTAISKSDVVPPTPKLMHRTIRNVFRIKEKDRWLGPIDFGVTKNLPWV